MTGRVVVGIGCQEAPLIRLVVRIIKFCPHRRKNSDVYSYRRGNSSAYSGFRNYYDYDVYDYDVVKSRNLNDVRYEISSVATDDDAKNDVWGSVGGLCSTSTSTSPVRRRKTSPSWLCGYRRRRYVAIFVGTDKIMQGFNALLQQSLHNNNQKSFLSPFSVKGNGFIPLRHKNRK